MSSGKVSRPAVKEIKRPFKVAHVPQNKQVWITDYVNKAVVVLNHEGNKSTTIKHKFEEPTGISFLPKLHVVGLSVILYSGM